MICVYTATHALTKMFYIGFTSNFENRKKSHYRAMRGGYHKNQWMQTNHGFDPVFTWTIIPVKSEEEGRILELQLIHSSRDNQLLMNTIGKEPSLETKALISKSNTERWTLDLREEASKKQSQIWTPEKCELQSTVWTPEKRQIHSQIKIGTRHSMVAKMKIATALRGKKKPPEQVAKTAEALSKRVVVDGMMFSSVSNAAISFGVSRKTVKNRVKSDFPKWKDWRMA